MAVSGPLRATGAGVSAAHKDNTKPSDEVLEIWRRADAVCFDVDCERSEGLGGAEAHAESLAG